MSKSVKEAIKKEKINESVFFAFFDSVFVELFFLFFNIASWVY